MIQYLTAWKSLIINHIIVIFGFELSFGCKFMLSLYGFLTAFTVTSVQKQFNHRGFSFIIIFLGNFTSFIQVNYEISIRSYNVFIINYSLIYASNTDIKPLQFNIINRINNHFSYMSLFEIRHTINFLTYRNEL